MLNPADCKGQADFAEAKNMKLKRAKMIVAICSFLLLISVVIWTNIRVNSYEKFTFDNIEKLDFTYCAVVLGTSKYLSNGKENQYYNNRIKAAVALYFSGKCKKLIVSGDNRRNDYNEAKDMKNDLIKLGIKENDIICDYAGTRTLDSIIRFKEIFIQNKGIVISQRFHNNRAIYIGRSRGVELCGFNANDVDRYHGFKTRLREILSKFVCVLEIEILKTNPKHLGGQIQIY
jgi:SanA protein